MKVELLKRDLTESEQTLFDEYKTNELFNLIDCSKHGLGAFKKKGYKRGCTKGVVVKEDMRGKSKKNRRSGREVIKDISIIDPNNRPDESEMTGNGGKDGNMERLVYKSIDWIKEGLSLDVCREILCNEINPSTNKPFHERFVNQVVYQANRLIKQSYTFGRSEIVILHINRYDKEIIRLVNQGYDHIGEE